MMKARHERMVVFTINAERNVYDTDPPFQREGGVWSEEKKQLFIDSLLNGYDIPKIYLREVERDSKGRPKQYAIVDGKQRLTAIWDFYEGQYALAQDFDFERDKSKSAACQGKFYADAPDEVRKALDKITLDVVVITTDDDEDIEELFSRLNNGAPLNAAEKRNAIGGAVIEIIRAVACSQFFKDHTTIPVKRMQHHEAAAKFLLIEEEDAVTDLKKKHLDKLAKDGKGLEAKPKKALRTAVEDRLRSLCKVFDKKDPLLSKQAYLPLYYLLDREIERQYVVPSYPARMKAFLEGFEALRVQDRNSEERDSELADYDRHMQQGTNDESSLKERLAVLTKRFLAENPEAQLKDLRRNFNDSERFAIWILAKKRCAVCSRDIKELSGMEADHKEAHSRAGPTVLKNAQCLCIDCNQKKGNADGAAPK